MNPVGDWIAAELKARGWTQTELSWRAHASTWEVNHFIHGRRVPTLEKYVQIKQVFLDNLPKGRTSSPASYGNSKSCGQIAKLWYDADIQCL